MYIQGGAQKADKLQNPVVIERNKIYLLCSNTGYMF